MRPQILLVNANSLNIPLAPNSVHMACGSTPYFGLRDYGTGEWAGGDPDCEHIVGNQVADNKAPGAITSGIRPGANANVCKLCGAVREDEQIGLESLHDCLAWARGEPPCDDCFVCAQRKIAAQIWRVLRPDGTYYLNIDDSYCGYKGDNYLVNKAPSQLQSETAVPSSHNRGTPHSTGLKPLDMMGIPFRVFLALQADGWYGRADIHWLKNNPLPASVNGVRWERHRVKEAAVWQDCPGCPKCAPHDGYVLRRGSWRPTRDHEYIFMFTKTADYYADKYAVLEPIDVGSVARMMRGVSDQHKTANGVPGQSPQSMSAPRPNIKHVNEDYGGGGSSLIGHSGYTAANGQSLVDAAGRNLRATWEVNPQGYEGAHYATWPPGLPEKMILASTSEAGVCPHCGDPWARIIQKGTAEVYPGNPNPVMPYDVSPDGGNGTGATTLHRITKTETIGWKQTCNCPPHDPAPAVVLDPFCGSGTTGIVARQHGRHFIGLDLSYQYLHHDAKKRLSLDVLQGWEEGRGVKSSPTRKRPTKQKKGQLSLL